MNAQKKNRKSVLPAAAVAVLLFFGNLYAQNENDNPRMKFDLPLIDMPYQIDAMKAVDAGFFGSYSNPSMAQSLALSHIVSTGFNIGMDKFQNEVRMNRYLKSVLYAGGNFLFFYLPGSFGWLHEEYHRAVFARFRINSYNSVYDFNIGAPGLYAVARGDFTRLYESHADLVRLSSAGIEGQFLLVRRMQRDNFFYNQGLPNRNMYWTITMSSHLYMMSSLNSGITDRLNAEPDFTKWTRGLFHPREGRSSVDGALIDDFSSAERSFLGLQVGLHFLNYVSPTMFNIKEFALGGTGFKANFAMRHYLTSFGYDIAAEGFLKKNSINAVFIWHNFLNRKGYFPAVEAELIDYPLNLGGLRFLLSPRALIGTQPKDQEFRTSRHEFLGLVGLRVDYMATKHVLPFVEFSAKTDGWVAGDIFLDANASVRAGVSLRFYK